MSNTTVQKQEVMDDDHSAPILPIPDKQYLSVEYPGCVKRINKAIATLGGERALSDALSNNRRVQLSYRRGDPFSHPINSDTVACAKLLVKVTRRVKRDRNTGEVVKEDHDGYKVEIMGKIFKTVRFRAMADFQYLVHKTDKIRQLKGALLRGDVESIMKYEVPTDDDDMNNLRIIPPPIFSSLDTPFGYGYRQSAPVIRVRVKQPDGTYKVKLINRKQMNSQQITSIQYHEETVPTQSLYSLKPFEKDEDKAVCDKVKELFEKRPVWTRFAIKCELQFPGDKISHILVHHAYTFSNGPWRECWIKYGVDPRKDVTYHIYQLIDIRRYYHPNLNDNPKRVLTLRKNAPNLTALTTPQAVAKQIENSTPLIPGKQDYIFTGVSKPGATNVYQVCDLADPDFVSFKNNPLYLKQEPTKDAGFYYQCVFTRLRKSVRKKYLDLLERGSAESLVDDITDGLDKLINAEKEKSTTTAKDNYGKQESTTAKKSLLLQQAQQEEIGGENDSISSDTVEEAARQALAEMSRAVHGHDVKSDASRNSHTDAGNNRATVSPVDTSKITNKRLKDVVDDYMNELEKITELDDDEVEEVTAVEEEEEEEIGDEEEMDMVDYDEDLVEDNEEETKEQHPTRKS
ncbi:RNA polymerase III transcription factor IIIC subunit-domain-containing protein [Mycotypha africana]|uniref:RNA polymerase III transcription factor IIIC subunit-domain-containing protein n=1 Tax=Mycotypha africana TaxID=64632 RepID=UPI0023009FE0|nr:RNA polymerase III transcription factor IIIC subunit-domain-containing protein [Mycotypha africana]KAI8966932.1 RNA polymerase III transcription factor IIIC subunit-domain-containing protein [Mycotypha africana]